MQPVQHILLLTYTRIALAILAILATPMAQCGFRPIVDALAVVRFLPAAADKQEVARFDVAALGSRTDVDALMKSALAEVFVRYRVVVVGVVGYAFGMGVAAVVEKDAPSSYAVCSPVVDGTFLVSSRADYVGTFRLEQC
jgi:hypothetical protein